MTDTATPSPTTQGKHWFTTSNKKLSRAYILLSNWPINPLMMLGNTSQVVLAEV
jgi:hypothetical protein